MGRVSLIARVLPGILKELPDIIQFSRIMDNERFFLLLKIGKRRTDQRNETSLKSFLNQFRIFYRVIYFETRFNFFRQVVPLLTLFLFISDDSKRIIFKKERRLLDRGFIL